jgi:tetratricopeptide (TPR) repeat protein
VPSYRTGDEQSPAQLTRALHQTEYVPLGPRQVDFLLHIKEPERFYGREDELKHAEQALLAEKLPLLVYGFPGIGKSTFIDKLVNLDSVKAHFHGDIIGFELAENFRLEKIVARLAHGLGFTHILEWEDLDTRLGLLRQALYDRWPHHLIVLDNVDENLQMGDVKQFRNQVSSRIIVGSRSEFGLPLHEDSLLEISDLSLEPALRLFADHAKLTGNPVLTHDQQRTAAICKLLDNHPQAIVLAAGTLASPAMSLDDLQEYLSYDIELFKDAGGTRRETSIRVSFGVSYNQLTPDERVTFDACGAFALNGATVTAITAATGFKPAGCKTLLGALDKRSLVEYDPDAQWVHMHPLMRAYARRQLIERESGAALKDTVIGHMISYYKKYAEDNKSAFTLLDAEHDNLLQAAQWAYDKEDWAATYELWKSLDDWLDSIGDRKSQEQLIKWAIKASEQLERPVELSDAVCNWSVYLSLIDRPDDAKQAAEKSLALARQGQDSKILASALTRLGQVLQESFEEIASSHKLFEEAWAISQHIQDWDEVAFIAYELALNYERQGNLAATLEWLQKGEKIAQQTGSLLYESYALTSIGNWFAGQNQLEEAREYLQRSLEIKEKLKNKNSIKIALTSLARVEVKLNNLQIARELFNRAISICEEISAYASLIWALLDIGDTFVREQKYADAVAYYDQAVETSSKLVSKSQRVTELLSIGAAYVRLKQFDKAEKCYTVSLDLCPLLPGDSAHQYAKTYQAMGNLYQLQEKNSEALQHYKLARQYYEQARRKIEDRSIVISILRSLIEITVAEGDYVVVNQYIEQEVQLLIDQGKQKQASAILFNTGQKIYDQLKKKGGVPTMLAIYQQARRYLEWSVAIDEEFHNESGIIATLRVLVNVTIAEGDYSATDQYLKRIVDLLTAQGEQKQASVVLFYAGQDMYAQLRKQNVPITMQELYQQARHYLERSLEVGQGLINEDEMSTVLEVILGVIIAQRDYIAADHYVEQIAQRFIEQGKQKQASVFLHNVGRQIYEQQKMQDDGKNKEDDDSDDEDNEEDIDEDKIKI